MRERSENFNQGTDETEATLVAPRFDAEEARRAHPVVPLSEARPRPSLANSRAPARRGLPTSWTPALVAVVLLAVGALGGAVATRVFRPAQADPAPASAPAAVAPVQAAEVPVRPAPEPAALPPREEAREEAREEVRDEAQEEAREEARAKSPSPHPRGERRHEGEDREAARGRDAESGKGDEGRRGRGRGKESRRGREADDVEKDVRKALKGAGGKVPRLVDVLTNP